MKVYSDLIAEIEATKKNLASAKSPKMKKRYKNSLRKLKKKKAEFDRVYYGVSVGTEEL